MPARCVLCDRLLIVAAMPATQYVANPEAVVLCDVCRALPSSERRERRSRLMVRMLAQPRSGIRQRQ